MQHIGHMLRYCRVIAHEYFNPVPVIYIGLYVFTENTDLVNFFLIKKVSTEIKKGFNLNATSCSYLYIQIHIGTYIHFSLKRIILSPIIYFTIIKL